MPASATIYKPDLDYLLSNVLTIDELAGKQRYVTLRGGGLPFVGAAWGVKQNSPITWYPGNPEGSQQVLGGQMLPSDWEGEWKRTLLSGAMCRVGSRGGIGVQVVKPETLMEVFEALCLDGMRLRVKFRNITREGRLVEFTHNHGKTSDIEWHAKFDWVNRGSGADRRVQGVRSGNAGASIDEAQLSAETGANMEPSRLLVSTAPEKLPKGTPTMTLGQIGALLDAPNKMLTQFCRQARGFAHKIAAVGELINKARNLPARLANTALNETENMIALCNNTVDSLSRTSPEKMTLRQNAASVAKAATYYGSGVRQSTVIAGKCADVRNSLRRVRSDASGEGASASKDSPLTTDILAVHAIKQGETLISISAAYYGTPDNAFSIAKANRIAYPCAPDAGGRSIGGKRTLIIPVLDREG